MLESWRRWGQELADGAGAQLERYLLRGGPELEPAQHRRLRELLQEASHRAAGSWAPSP